MSTKAIGSTTEMFGCPFGLSDMRQTVWSNVSALYGSPQEALKLKLYANHSGQLQTRPLKLHKLLKKERILITENECLNQRRDALILAMDENERAVDARFDQLRDAILYGFVVDRSRCSSSGFEEERTAEDQCVYEELSCSINMVAGEMSKVQNEIEATVKEVNVAVCKRAAKKTYATLLRELRDMVYAYVTDERVKISRNFATKDGPYSRSHVQLMQHHPAPAGTWFTRQPRSAKDSICSALYWRDAVVGSAVALELVESWYSTATFVFHTDLDWRHVGTGLDRLPDVLKYDHFDTGFDVQKLIRKIR